MAELVVKSKVKDIVQEKGYKVSADLYVAMSDKVQVILEEGMQRADANGRKTVLVRDI